MFLRSRKNVTCWGLAAPLSGLFWWKGGPALFWVIREASRWLELAPTPACGWVTNGTLLLSCQILQPSGILCMAAKYFPCGCDAGSRGLSWGRTRLPSPPRAASATECLGHMLGGTSDGSHSLTTRPIAGLQSAPAMRFFLSRFQPRGGKCELQVTIVSGIRPQNRHGSVSVTSRLAATMHVLCTKSWLSPLKMEK